MAWQNQYLLERNFVLKIDFNLGIRSGKHLKVLNLNHASLIDNDQEIDLILIAAEFQ